LRLLYKGKPLRDDHLPAKAYNLKQHSEIMCVISEVEANGAQSEHSYSDEDGSVVTTTGRRTGRVRAKSTTRDSRTNYHEQRSEQPQAYYPPSSPSHHSPSLSPSSNTRPANENLSATPMEKQSSKQSNASYHSPPRGRSPNPPVSHQNQDLPRSSANSINTPVDANSPLGKVKTLASVFHTQWLPKCTQFLLSPPSDSRTRGLEYAKLTESVLAQIILKADDIELQGDSEARAARKTLLNETSEVLRRLDAIGKPSQ